MHVPALVSLFKEGITAYYTRVRAFLEGTEAEPPPRLTVIPEAMQRRIEHLCEVTRQRVSRFIIAEQDAEPAQFIKKKTRSIFKENPYRSSRPSNQTKGKTALRKRTTHQIKNIKKRKKPLCFFCGKKEHRGKYC